ncbi:hypothetical protein LX32DRAFT_261231 [Colletotrichum zoysiae]|uniref:Uncharacterized protein n=1 Tax=Colletotrichum zoysiae TaxID=1216348 RepID=A0AAD9H2Q1_9PEZI|nr:hypothetical protein LX32DRAFT_261231 [Colletotrichum zoysiae]
MLLPRFILFHYCYCYCYSHSRGGGGVVVHGAFFFLFSFFLFCMAWHGMAKMGGFRDGKGSFRRERLNVGRVFVCGGLFFFSFFFSSPSSLLWIFICLFLIPPAPLVHPAFCRLYLDEQRHPSRWLHHHHHHHPPPPPPPPHTHTISAALMGSVVFTQKSQLHLVLSFREPASPAAGRRGRGGFTWGPNRSLLLLLLSLFFVLGENWGGELDDHR